MKKGFTLAEVLITLVVLGIVAALTVPLLNGIRPDKDKTTYQKAMYNIQGAMSSVMQDPMATMSRDYWANPDVPNSGFCEVFADSLNTTGAIECSGSSSYESPNFVSSDGILYWGFEGNSFTKEDERGNKYRVVYVDRELSDRERKQLSKTRDERHASPGMKVQITARGKVQTGTDNDWDFENNILKQFTTSSK